MSFYEGGLHFDFVAGYNNPATTFVPNMKILKKITCVLSAAAILVLNAGFKSEDFSLDSFKNYTREFKSTSIGACSNSSTKTYEDYRLITSTGSAQYQYIHNHMTVADTTGFLYDEEGFVGVAMGYSFGEIGTRYYIVLDTGTIIPVVKVDAKASVDATDGCSANADASVIEFVIDSDKAKDYFGQGPSGLAAQGNLNNYSALNGHIKDIELVSDEKLESGVIYQDTQTADPSKGDEDSDNIKLVQGGY